MLVTGGLGGLGLIASYHCAAEFDNPIITTSRSGKLPPSAGPGGQLIYEAMKDLVPVYNVQCDVGNTKSIADLFAWLNRPGLPFDDRSMLIDDVLEQLNYKMNTMPQEALQSIQDFLGEMLDKLEEIISDLMSRETKVNLEVVGELRAKHHAVAQMMERLKSKVGNARRGYCHLAGGVPMPAYTMPDSWEEEDQPNGQTAEQLQPSIDKHPLLGLMQEEIEKDVRSARADLRPSAPLDFDKSTLSQMMRDMQD